jgi:hypothetical protein
MEESATIYRFCAWIAPLGLREHSKEKVSHKSNYSEGQKFAVLDWVDGGMMLSRATEERERKCAVKKLLSVTKENAGSKLLG